MNANKQNKKNRKDSSANRKKKRKDFNSKKRRRERRKEEKRKRKEEKKKRKEEKRKQKEERRQQRKEEKRKQKELRKQQRKEEKKKAVVAEETKAPEQNRTAPPPIPTKRVSPSPEERRRRREKIVQAHQKRLQATIKFCIQGTDVLKYNKGNKNASVKWLGFDKSRKIIGWGSNGKMKTKIPLSDITVVFYGVCTPNLLRHIGYVVWCSIMSLLFHVSLKSLKSQEYHSLKPQENHSNINTRTQVHEKKPWECFSFRTKQRTYDFVAHSGQVATQFVFGIQQLSQSAYRHPYGTLLLRRVRMRLNYSAARNNMTVGKVLTHIAKKVKNQLEGMKRSKKSFVGDDLTKLIEAARNKPNIHARVDVGPGSLGVKLREAPDLWVESYSKNLSETNVRAVRARAQILLASYYHS